MKKTMAFGLLLVLLLSSVCLAQDEEKKLSDREKELLLGPVKSVEVQMGGFSTKFGKMTENTKREPAGIFRFNTDGRLLEKSTPTQQEVWVYAKNGQITQHSFFERSKEGEEWVTVWKYTWDYDAKGNLVSEAGVERGKSLTYRYTYGELVEWRRAYVWDEKGRLKEAYEGSLNTSIQSEFVYGKNGKLEEVNEYNTDGALFRKRVYEPYEYGETDNIGSEFVYDSDGVLVEDAERRYTISGGLYSKEIAPDEYTDASSYFPYDVFYERRGSKISVYRGIPAFQMDESDHPWVFKDFDLKGRLVRIGYGEPGINGDFDGKDICTYDSNGNLAQIDSYNHAEDGLPRLSSRVKFAYEFDEKGNWIKRTASKYVGKFSKLYFEPYEVIYRIIEYHDWRGDSDGSDLLVPANTEGN